MPKIEEVFKKLLQALTNEDNGLDEMIRNSISRILTVQLLRDIIDKEVQCLLPEAIKSVLSSDNLREEFKQILLRELYKEPNGE